MAKIFLAGGTGVLGRHLLPLLLAEGHEVHVLTRSRENVRSIEEAGARVVIADALDRQPLTAAVERAAPEVIIHQLTSHGGLANFRRLDEHFVVTNRLRTEAADTMLAAGAQVGVRRFIAQSFCGWPFARVSGTVKSEDDALDPTPPKSFRQTLGAIRYLEDRVLNCAPIEGVVLRYGFLYGPDTAIADDGAMVDLVRRRRFPIVGSGAGVWSFVHVKDAAQATLAAVTQGDPGLYNIVDDEPAPVYSWLPFLAQAAGAKPPRQVAAWRAKWLIGEGGVVMMIEVRGGANAKAKSAFGWQPEYASWRDGFVRGLGTAGGVRE